MSNLNQLVHLKKKKIYYQRVQIKVKKFYFFYCKINLKNYLFFIKIGNDKLVVNQIA